MPQDASCPKCSHTFPVTEARQAYTVACPRCETDITVEFKKPAAPPEAGQPPYDLLVKPGALPNSPAPPPTPKKKNKDDDDDDEPKRKGGSAAIVLLSGGLSLLFVLGGLGTLGWYLFTQIDTTETVSNRPNNSNKNSNTNNNNNKNNTPNNNNKGGKTGGDTSIPPGTPKPKESPKPKDVFDLKPVTGSLPEITAPPLTENVTPIVLPGKVGQIAVGGGGRYIVMHFPDRGQLGMFDVSTAAEPTLVACDNGDVRLAAGLSRVVLFAPNGKMLRVYSLPDLKKLYETESPLDNYRSLAMGSQTNGPVLGVNGGELVLMDVKDNGIKVIEGSLGRPGHHGNNLRAAPNGTVFTTFDGFGGGNKVKLLTVANRKWKVTDLPQVPFPGVDGNFYGNGLAVSRTGQQVVTSGVGAGSGTWFIPAITGSGGDFVKMTLATTGGAKAKRGVALTVHSGGNADTPVAGSVTMIGPEVDTLMDRNGQIPRDKAPDQHLFYVPEAKLLILLSGNKDKLILRKTNPNG